MFTYPKILRNKDLKKISKYPCDDEIKDAYLKYLTNYSFEEFVDFCEANSESDLNDLIFRFADLQLEKFEPNSLPWISCVLVNFMIYFNVNLDYGEYYDAYATVLQFSVLSISLKMTIDRLSFDEVSLSPYSIDCFDEFFARCPDFNFNLKKDCELAYKSFNQNFKFSYEEYYEKIRMQLENKGYLN